MENFIVSPRKYRPATFDTVVGQESITSTLKNAIRNNTLAQAFLFCGPRGVGKTTCARIMAKTVNCLNRTENFEACNECESCKAFNNNASFNIYELDAASNNSVDDIRNLVEQVRIPPQIGKYKVYIIDEVHMLSKDAFNAFLKTLEEPPAYAKFILATTEKHKIIPTILSRCQIFDFKRITVEDIAKHLAFVASQEGISAEPEALNIIAQKADGALRDALSIFDQMVSFCGQSITYKAVIDNLNVLDHDYYFKVTDYILHADTGNMLLLLNDVISKGFEPQHFICGLGEHLRNLLVSKDADTTQLLEVSGQLRQRYEEQSKCCTMPFLIDALAINNQSDLDYRGSSNKRLHLEIALLKMCALTNTGLHTDEPVQTPQRLPSNQPADVKTKPQPAVQPTKQPAPPQPHAIPSAPANQPLPQTPHPTPSTSPKNKGEPPHTQIETPAPVSSMIQDKAPSVIVDQKPEVKRRGIQTSGFSINAEEESEKLSEEDESTWDLPFTQEDLLKSWNDFVGKYRSISPNFAAGLGKYKPRLEGNHEIHFSVDNTLIQDDSEGMASLKNHLKHALHNNQFMLIPEIMDKPAETQAYTDKEKFEKMSKDYPILNTLQTELNLECDL